MKTGEFCVREVVTATRDESVREAAHRMIEHRVGSLVVVDSAAADSGGPSRPIGIVTHRDLVRTLSLGDSATSGMAAPSRSATS